MGRQYRDGLLAFAEYNRMLEVIREQEYLEGSYFRGQGPMRPATPLKKKKKKNIVLLGILQEVVEHFMRCYIICSVRGMLG